MAIITDKHKIDDLLTRRVVEAIVGDSLRERLMSGKKLRIKLGFDPTAPDIHLGHTVSLRKLKEFQDLGHQIVFIVGDYTARVGDPTGKSKTRPMLSDKDVEKNAKTYLAQIGKVLDVKKAEVRRNSEWFKKMTFTDILELTSKFTVARMIERDDFENRLNEGADVHVHELLYPMMQAYDSVMIDADVELGGTDQKFNLLAGRELQKKLGKTPQDVLIVGPILVGTDGAQKMSKSLGNYIGISDAPEDMFGKVMSVPDAAMWDYYDLATDITKLDILEMRTACEQGRMNPRDAKVRLAKGIVSMYHSAKAADAAEAHFTKVFSKKEQPEDMMEVRMEGERVSVAEALVAAGFVPSKTEARRQMVQGAVRVNGKVVKNIDESIALDPKIPAVLQKGKRFFVKLLKK